MNSPNSVDRQIKEFTDMKTKIWRKDKDLNHEQNMEARIKIYQILFGMKCKK